MSIKEKPLINAVKNPDALPGFLFVHRIVTGFFAMAMCAVFGGVVVLFWSLNGKALEVFDLVRAGAYAGLGLGGFIYLGIFMSAFNEPDEKSYRLQFVAGGVLAIACFVGLDWQFTDDFRAEIAEKGYLICTSQVPGCD